VVQPVSHGMAKTMGRLLCLRDDTKPLVDGIGSAGGLDLVIRSVARKEPSRWTDSRLVVALPTLNLVGALNRSRAIAAGLIVRVVRAGPRRSDLDRR
jgi:hypothetical protein